MDQFSRNDHGDMRFSSEPTARGDEVADFMRQWYEANRETWFDRHQLNPLGRATDRSGVHADEFMLGLMNEARRILDAANTKA